jgi:hypothetical protein
MGFGASQSLAEDCQKLVGTIGASPQWGSGWIDLSSTELKAGNHLRLTIGGSAEKVLVRILRQGEPPDSASGILDQFVVPEDRVIDVKLDQDFSGVRQISVHGGPNPWGQFPLGGGNGPATLMNAELCEI